ncbi:Outer membrane protein A precursor [Azoarcus sp. Aa7]|nr:Outer membrane protein A precursor [Azoarcus sp. Aa7]
MKTTTAALLLTGAAFLLPAQAAEGYLSDTSGVPVTSGADLCWRTGSWTPANATGDCDAELVRVHRETTRVTMIIPRPTPPAPAPTTPQRARLIFAADPLFDFDGARLRATGKAKLDALAAHLTAAGDIAGITVIGHTDRLGSAPHNQRLSEQRAATVRDYLAGAGVPADRILAEGRGESEPATAAEACPGTTRSPTLVACLQPDRRVEVEAVVDRETH